MKAQRRKVKEQDFYKVMLHTDEGTVGDVEENGSLQHKAVPVHVNSTLQEAAPCLKRSTNCQMKETPTSVLGLEM